MSRGGRRPGAGRKPLYPGERMVFVSALIPESLAERLRKAGSGNVSLGIRRLAERKGE